MHRFESFIAASDLRVEPAPPDAPTQPRRGGRRSARSADDVVAVADWLAANGGTARGPSGARLFAYAVASRRAGDPAGLVRRRIVAVCADAERHGAAASIGAAALLRRLGRLEPDRPSALVVADDAGEREGIAERLGRRGVHAWPAAGAELSPALAGGYDGVLVAVDGHRGADPFGVVGSVRARLDGAPRSTARLIAVSAAPVPPMVRLRLAEAGFAALLPLAAIEDRRDGVAALLGAASVPPRFRIEAPDALRAGLGLAAGALDPFLQVCLQHAPEQWAAEPPTGAPLAPRTERLLRQLAVNVAGLPAGGTRAAAPAVRAAGPELPEWERVRALVRAALGDEG